MYTTNSSSSGTTVTPTTVQSSDGRREPAYDTGNEAILLERVELSTQRASVHGKAQREGCKGNVTQNFSIEPQKATMVAGYRLRCDTPRRKQHVMNGPDSETGKLAYCPKMVPTPALAGCKCAKTSIHR